MGNIGLLKRALPFLGTFALGLFIASFFVNISPRFEHHERGRCHRDMWEMRIENEQLRDENQQLREQLNEQDIPSSKTEVNKDSEDVIDPVDITIFPTYPAKKGHDMEPKASKAHK